MRRRFLILSFFLLSTFLALGQEVKVRGQFLLDSAKVGKYVPFSLTARYSKDQDVLFPDSTFSFAPFEFYKKNYFTTVTKDTLSYDSVVYYLATYETDRLQKLRLPVFVIQPRDCTKVFSQEDSLNIVSTVKSFPDSLSIDQLPVKMNTAYQKVDWTLNYPLLTLLVGVLIAGALIVWTVFGKRIREHFRQKRLLKRYQAFLGNFNRLTEELKSDLTAPRAEEAMTVWKKYMEELSDVPYTKYTTREIKLAFAGNDIGTSLSAIDRMIYGHITLESLDAFQQLKSEAENSFRKKAARPDLVIDTDIIAPKVIETAEEPIQKIAPVQLTRSGIEGYADLLRELPCPFCGKANEKLNGTTLHTVKSFIVLTSYKKNPIVGCPTCLNRKNNLAILSTALLGWWGFPWGLIKTPQYLYLNIKEKKKIRSKEPNDVLLSFAYTHADKIEVNKHNKQKLEDIIKTKKSWWQW
ncbi:MAG TPA: LapA family protein [Cyclobacteriaceae bacterium]